MLWWNICNNNLRFCSSHLLGFSSSLQLSRMSSLTFLFLLSLTYMAPCPCSWWFELLVINSLFLGGRSWNFLAYDSLRLQNQSLHTSTTHLHWFKIWRPCQNSWHPHLILSCLEYDIMIVPSSFQSLHIAAKLTQYCSKTNSNDFSSGHKVVFLPSVLASHK